MNAFGIVVLVVTVTSALVSIAFYARANRLYQQIGRLGELWLDASENPAADGRDASREDLRQMVDAVSRSQRSRRARRAARSERPPFPQR